jgi:hypothetical protein
LTVSGIVRQARVDGGMLPPVQRAICFPREVPDYSSAFVPR